MSSNPHSEQVTSSGTKILAKNKEGLPISLCLEQNIETPTFSPPAIARASSSRHRRPQSVHVPPEFNGLYDVVLPIPPPIASGTHAPRPHPAQPTNTDPLVAHPHAKQQQLPRAPSTPPPGPDDWTCALCPYVQHGSGRGRRGREAAAFARHMQTHRECKTVLWICRGVLQADGSRHGGCGREYSRRDALKRHIDRELGSCRSDILPLRVEEGEPEESSPGEAVQHWLAHDPDTTS